jgi:hypothetical protein
MKSINKISLFLIIFLFTQLKSIGQGLTPLKTPDDFAKAVYLAIKTNNFDYYERTVPTLNELKVFSESIKGSPEYTQEIHIKKKENRLKWFSRIISDAAKTNLNLSVSKYCGFRGKIDTLNNLQFIFEGYICIEIGLDKHYIKCDKIFFINNEWKSVENLLGIKSQLDDKIILNFPLLTQTSTETASKSSSEKPTDADFEEFLKESNKIIIQSSGVKVSADNFSKGIPFASTINTASDKRHYTDSELKEANKPENIIGKPIKIGKLLVAQNEFPKKSDWNNAKAMCLKLGPGWRLPTKDEIYILYQNKNILRNFSKYGYWSSTEGSMNGNNGVAYFQDFSLGSKKPSLENKLSTWGVRAVKSL